jgi:hypothetical protein
MALLWIDGFDSYGTTVGNYASPTGIYGRKYATGGTGNRIENPRVPGNGRSLGIATYIMTPALTTNPTLIAGVGFKLVTGAGTQSPVLSFYDDGVACVSVVLNVQTGELAVWRWDNSTGVLLGSTSGLALRRNQWYFIELKVYCHASDGTVDVRVNGVSKLALSGVCTKRPTQTHDYYNIVRLSHANNTDYHVDDFYVCDTAAGRYTDVLGPVKVVTSRPASDVDGKKDWTPQSGADHYAMLDEAVCNDDTDYVESSTSGHLDQCEYSDVSSSTFTELRGVALSVDCRKTDATDFTLIQRAERATASEGAANAVAGTSYVTHVRVMESDTEGAAWTPANFDSTQFGIKVG